MGIPEMQRQFKAYGSGQLPEFELRRAIRAALSEEPRLSQALIDLIDAYRRAEMIDAGLYSTLNSDIAEVVGPYMEMTMVSPAGIARRPWQQDSRAATSTDVNLPSINITSPLSVISLPARPPTYTTPPASSSPTVSTTGAGWDAGQLNVDATPLYPGCVF